MYKEFVIKEQFNGLLGNLIEDIVEAFVNEKIGQSKLGKFYNIAGLITLEEFGDITSNAGVDVWMDAELDMDGDLEEEIIKKSVTGELLRGIRSRNIELIDNDQIKALREIMLDSHIKATYTLAYS